MLNDHIARSFTVVVATFNRGPHIVPTIEAALDQTFTDFELLVIADGDAGETLNSVPRNDSRVGVISLPWNSGSQAVPNNVGIALARGRYVAYLGHDDIWMPNHLARLADVLERTGCDVAVSGCIYHGPPSTDVAVVTGLGDLDATRHFFPPTSLAHRRSMALEIGGWRSPRSLTAPVDADFLMRAAEVGRRFVSTGEVTAPKFAAGHRYLSYLEPSSAEQSDILAAIRSGALDQTACANYIDRAKAAGTFMNSEYPDFSSLQPGHLFRQNQSNKGINRATPVPLAEEVYVPQTDKLRAYDWHPLEQLGDGAAPFRWSGPSLRPKLFIPFTGDVDARIILHLSSYDPGKAIDDTLLMLNGKVIEHQARRDHPARVDLEFIGRLQAEKPSVITLIIPREFCPAEATGGSDRRRLGVMMTGFTVAPVEGRSLRSKLPISRRALDPGQAIEAPHLAQREDPKCL